MANKITQNIPNTITCCNLISGCIAVTSALYGAMEMALLWIIIGAVFDFFDGMSARLLHISSPVGKELDSLADVITFGLAPAMIVFRELTVLNYPSFLTPISPLLPFFAFVLVAFSALRLAKFNLDERQTTSFIGLPTPANALFWGALLLGFNRQIEAFEWSAPLLLVGICISSWLLVSEIPMFALKFKHWQWRGNELKYIFILTCIPLLIFFQVSAFAFIVAWYVILSIYADATQKSNQ